MTEKDHLERIEAKLDLLIGMLQPVKEVVTPLVEVREGHHNLTPTPDELRRRANARNR